MNETLSPSLHQVRAAFADWRRERVGRARIPEPLWAAAVALLRQFSVSVVSRELQLNSKELRRRCNNMSQFNRVNSNT